MKLECEVISRQEFLTLGLGRWVGKGVSCLREIQSQ